MSRKFCEIEVVEPLTLPAGTILKLDDKRAQDRIHELTRHGSENGLYRALKPMSFKAGEKIEAEIDVTPKLARTAKIDGKSIEDVLKEAEEKPGSTPIAEELKGPEVKEKEAKDKARLEAEAAKKAEKKAAKKAEKAPAPKEPAPKEPAKKAELPPKAPIGDKKGK